MQHILYTLLIPECHLCLILPWDSGITSQKRVILEEWLCQADKESGSTLAEGTAYLRVGGRKPGTLGHFKWCLMARACYSPKLLSQAQPWKISACRFISLNR